MDMGGTDSKNVLVPTGHRCLYLYLETEMLHNCTKEVALPVEE